MRPRETVSDEHEGVLSASRFHVRDVDAHASDAVSQPKSSGDNDLLMPEPMRAPVPKATNALL